MERKTIVFYNFWNFGDIYFSQPYISNIIKNNPNYDFYYACKQGDFIFNNVKDLKIVDLTIFIDLTNKSHTHYFYNQNKKILFINTWVVPMHFKYMKYNIIPDTVIDILHQYNIQTIEDINKNFNFNIIFDKDINIIPELPIIDLTSYDNFKKQNNDKTIIFYYNYLPQSGQQVPVKTEEDHNKIIVKLSNNNNNIILLPEINEKLDKIIKIFNKNNIYDANKLFNLDINRKCYNIIYYGWICMKCNYSIHYDSGRAFTYINNYAVNNDFITKRLHISNNNDYYQRMNKIIKKNICSSLICCNVEQIINKLNELIK